ncbi:MAG: hypothetical protein ACPHK8_00895 [Thermoplasmatota archaeon]
MKTTKKTSLMMACLLIAVGGVSAADADIYASDSKCNNNGIVVQVTVTGNNNYECEANTMYCDNTTGAGAGAGAGGPSQSNEAGAEAGASGRCNQYNGGYMSCSSVYSEQHCTREPDIGS